MRSLCKHDYSAYLLVAAAVVPIYTLASSATAVLLLGPIIGFWGSGFFSGFSVIASEAFPTALRGRAMGMAYNLGRIVSAAAPLHHRQTLRDPRHRLGPRPHLSRVPAGRAHCIVPSQRTTTCLGF